jgi:hypothetical protein
MIVTGPPYRLPTVNALDLDHSSITTYRHPQLPTLPAFYIASLVVHRHDQLVVASTLIVMPRAVLLTEGLVLDVAADLRTKTDLALRVRRPSALALDTFDFLSTFRTDEIVTHRRAPRCN